IKGKSIVFFWTENANSHFVSSHKKAMDLKRKFPEYSFIAINVDNDQAKWKSILSNYKFENSAEYQIKNFEALKEKWVITKIQRAMVINADGTINNAFVNLFDAKFADSLK
ncbi:MAG TPA: thioredoxin-like domain-containing protein, partial [Flavobacterium sp.]|nr:thioredoxin-like domain-containing protein [Flavobacterium sp.]